MDLLDAYGTVRCYDADCRRNAARRSGSQCRRDHGHTVKEWAYAGYTFNLLGASASHAFSGDTFGKIITPLIILALVLASYRQWKNITNVVRN
jgi:hypothetical protein